MYRHFIRRKKAPIQRGCKGIWGYLAPLRRLVSAFFVVVQGDDFFTPIVI
ncbi:hypothetical protein CPL00169_CDS0116 [Escherichia phage LinBro]